MQYGNLQKNQVIYEHILEQLTQEPDQVIARSRQLEGELKAASRQLNALLEEISRTADEMAKENRFNLSLEYDESNAVIVTINHTHGISDLQENFLLITLFCALCGICCDVFFAVCKETCKQKKQKAQVS